MSTLSASTKSTDRRVVLTTDDARQLMRLIDNMLDENKRVTNMENFRRQRSAIQALLRSKAVKVDEVKDDHHEQRAASQDDSGIDLEDETGIVPPSSPPKPVTTAARKPVKVAPPLKEVRKTVPELKVKTAAHPREAMNSSPFVRKAAFKPAAQTTQESQPSVLPPVSEGKLYNGQWLAYPPGDSRNVFVPPVRDPLVKKDEQVVLKSVDKPVEPASKVTAKPAESFLNQICNKNQVKIKLKTAAKSSIKTADTATDKPDPKVDGLKRSTKVVDQPERRAPVANMAPKPVAGNGISKADVDNGDGKVEVEKGEHTSSPTKQSPEVLVPGTKRKAADSEHINDDARAGRKAVTISSPALKFPPSPAVKEPVAPQMPNEEVPAPVARPVKTSGKADTTTTTTKKRGSSESNSDSDTDDKPSHPKKVKKLSPPTPKKSKRTADDARLDSGLLSDDNEDAHPPKRARSVERLTSATAKFDKKSTSPSTEEPQAKPRAIRPVKKTTKSAASGNFGGLKGVAMPKGRALRQTEREALEKRRRRSEEQVASSDAKGKGEGGAATPPVASSPPSPKRKRDEDDISGDADADARAAKREKL